MAVAPSPVRVYDGIMELLNFGLLERKHPGGGRPAYPPKLLAKLLIFAYAEGIRSAREIARRLEYDLRFLWLAHELCPCHETLSNFPRDFQELLKEALEESGQKRVSVTDPEALQQKVNDVCRTGYSGQLAVDDKAGFAVAQTVTTDQNDQQQFVPMAREVERNVDAPPDACVGDSGNHSPETLEALEAAPRLKDCS